MASSWPAPPAYPPRRSRSRSPYRGGYPARPPYPEPGYGDPYRADWEAYDRDRAWASYERDRATYDYGRRGRSRSPGLDDAGRKRRRSMSPYDSRYDPRPRFGEDYDYGRHGRSPPRPYGSSRPGPPDPRNMDYPSSLKQYAEWFRFNYPQEATAEDNADKAAELEAGDGSKPRNGIRARWEQYKKDFTAQQISRMFDHHRKSPWFQEKYNPEPEYANLRLRVRQKGWRGRLNMFLDGLEVGQFDPDLSESQPEGESVSPAKEGASNGDDTAANGVLAMGEETKPVTGEVEEPMDDEAGDNEAAKQEANGKGPVDLGLDPRRAGRGEEVTVPNDGNQVMIRTIPPDIGRLKLEEAIAKIPGYVYIALGDPLQKRNFYRAGWIKFREDADMPIVLSELTERKIEGFKLHVTHLLKPFSNRVRFAPEVASRPDRMEKDLANVKALAMILENEYNQLRTAKIPPAGAAIVPPPSENAAENAEKTEPTDGDVKMEEEQQQPSEEEPEPEPRESGSTAVERRVERLLSDFRESGALDGDNEKALEAKKIVLSLDLYLAYLRAAFHTCYYCALVTDHAEELQRKCIKHERKPLSKALLEEIKAAEEAAEVEKQKEQERTENGTPFKQEDGDEEKEKEPEKTTAAKDKPTETRDWKRNDERWLDWLDSKVALLINREGVNPKDYGGKNYDEELSKVVEAHIKQEDEGKFRCKECQKLFKATAFVEKHVANKHPECIKPMDDLPYFNNFALDPHRIQPFNHPPSTVPINQAPPPQAYGMHGPPGYPPPDYGRGAPYLGGYGQGYPPPYANGPYYDPYAHPAYAGPAGVYPPRRDDGRGAGRLSDRIGAYAPGYESLPDVAVSLPAGVGLPQKPVAATLEPGPGARRGGRAPGGPPPPPPPDAKEDPRAAAGRKVSYHDMDLVAEGDVELNY